MDALPWLRIVLLLTAGGCGDEPASKPKGGGDTVRDKNDPEPRPIQVVWGEESAGLQSRVWTDKPRFNTREPIPVHYAIRNAAKEAKTVWHSGFWPNHRIDLTGPDGKPARSKTGGEVLWTSFQPGGTREKNAPVRLAPGAIDDAYEAYDLRDVFDLSRPGDYTVRYVYQETRTERVESNPLTITVVPPG